MKKIIIVMFIMLNIIAINACTDTQKNDIDNEEGSMDLYEQKMNNSDNAEDIIPLEVSIIQLIANPAEYDGKKIAVHGVGNLSYEGTSVYLCEDNWYYLATKNAIWLSIKTELIDGEWWYCIADKRISYDDAQEYNGKYVLVEGTFNMNTKGHRGGYSGVIYNITRFTDCSDIYQHGMEINSEG